MNRAHLEGLRATVAANIAGGADLLSERRMLRLLDALLEEAPSVDAGMEPMRRERAAAEAAWRAAEEGRELVENGSA